MEPSRHLAFDLGATSGRAILGTLDGETLDIEEISRFPNPMLPIHGHLHWNIFALYEHILDGLRTAAVKGVRIDSVGIDTWGVDFGLMAQDGSLLGLPYTYRDPRTEGAMERFCAKLPKERIYERTGIQFLPLNTLFQLEAMRRDASPLLDVAGDLLFIPDLLHYLLTGVKKTEYTFATTSQLLNIHSQGWDEELFEALGIDPAIMQEIVPPGSILGTLTDDLARRTGIGPLPVVAVATHDTASAIAAIPAEGEHWAYISSGTWSLVGIESKTPLLDEKSLAFNITNEGGVENRYRVLKNVTGMWLLEECRKRWSEAGQEPSFDVLLDEARQARSLASLIDPDYPAFSNPEHMPDAIAERCRESGEPVPKNRGETVRCILESLALKSRFVLDRLQEASGRSIETVHVIGGGSRNSLLCQFTADATGRPVVAGPVEATAIGNLLVQAMALGRLENLDALRAVVRNTVQPAVYEPQKTEAWDRAYARFAKLVTN